jgi:hypothetical protein
VMLDAVSVKMHRASTLFVVGSGRGSALQSHADRDNLLAFVDRRA